MNLPPTFSQTPPTGFNPNATAFPAKKKRGCFFLDV